MIKKTIILLCLILNVHIWSQVNFEKGYYIDINNRKNEGLIKNEDWNESPNQILFKKDSLSQSFTIKTSDLLEFQVDGSSKYIKKDVQLDMSSEDLNNLSSKKAPEWESKAILLKCIVESQFSLYEYKNGKTIRYFCSKDNSNIEQLVFKKYKIDLSYYENASFMQQLYMGYKCQSTTTDRVKRVNYELSSLKRYFLEVNNCNGSTIIEKTRQSKDKVNFKIKAGINSSSLLVDFIDYRQDIKFDNEVTYRVGLELEYVLPFNRNKWSLFLEPSYQSKYKSKKETFYQTSVIGNYSFVSEGKYAVSYNTFDFLLGAKYYMFTSKNSKLFLDLGLVHSLDINKNIERDSNEEFLLTSTATSFSYGLGFVYKKISIEYRYSKRNVLDKYLSVGSSFNTSSLILGYSIFSTNSKNPIQK
jgi:hypothetical protein